jgi:rRNA maturation RNase YbeY
VEENAKTHNAPIQEELRRVLIHGILHCCGFTDKTNLKETEMRLKENELLMLFHVEPNPTSDV